nr:hypothetical protein Iba_chr13eCG12440 [Ipomoea batatas]
MFALRISQKMLNPLKKTLGSPIPPVTVRAWHVSQIEKRVSSLTSLSFESPTRISQGYGLRCIALKSKRLTIRLLGNEETGAYCDKRRVGLNMLLGRFLADL